MNNTLGTEATDAILWRACPDHEEERCNRQGKGQAEKTEKGFDLWAAIRERRGQDVRLLVVRVHALLAYLYGHRYGWHVSFGTDKVESMPDIAAALQMLDTFTSVGAEFFVVTKTELEWPGHKKVKWGKAYSAAELREKLPAMVRTAAQRRPYAISDSETMMAGENLIIRPIRGDVSFVQLD